MKKIIAISLMVVMLLSLASCSAFNKTYEAEGFSIELSPTFIDGKDIADKVMEQSSYSGRYAAYTSLIEGITIIAGTDSLENYNGNVYAYAEDMAVSFDVDPYDVFMLNGAPAFECYQDFYAFEMQAIAICYETDNGEVWFVTAMCKPEKFEEKREKMIEYLESVEVE